MRHLRCAVLLLACVSALFMSGLAWAEATKPQGGFQPYVGVYGGVAIPETFDNVTADSRAVGDLKLKTGSIFGVKMGLIGHSKDAVWRWIGAEVDLSAVNTALRAQPFRVAGLGSIPVSQTDVSFLTGALHILVKYPDGLFQPYAGIGPALVHTKVNGFAIGPSRISEQTSNDIGLSLVAGARMAFSEHIGGFVEYKQIRAALDFNDVSGDATIHAGVVGVNLTF